MDTNNVQPPVGGQTGIVGRAKRIILSPKEEWARIDVEPATVKSLYTHWILILAAIPAIAAFIGAVVFGYRALGVVIRPSTSEALSSSIAQYLASVVGIYIFALIIDWLAPHFGGTSNRIQALKVAAYSATASWLAGIFAILPALAFLGILGFYSIYLIYTGLPRLMKVPQDRALTYTIVTIIVAFVLLMAISALMASIVSFG